MMSRSRKARLLCPCISSLGSSVGGLIPCIIFADAPQLPSKIFHFTRTRRFARAFDRCHGDSLARRAPPRAFGLKKRTSRPLVSRAGTRRASLRLRCLCARCARALVPHREHAASLADQSIARSMLPATHRVPFSWRSARSVAGGKTLSCARHMCARASSLMWAAQRFVGSSTTNATF